MISTRSGHTRGTAKDKLREGIWSGEVPEPCDSVEGPTTRPPGVPKCPGPATDLYHNNDEYMQKSPKTQVQIDKIPTLIEQPRCGRPDWKVLKENNTPQYAGITWNIGDIYSEIHSFMFIGSLYDSLESYWQSMSMHLYDSPTYWVWVKAQHVEFLNRVLKDHHHPRFAYYTLLNSQFRQMPQEYQSLVAPKSPRNLIAANLWQTLLVPKQFVNHFMMQVTADLYSIYLVLFLHTNLNEDYINYEPDFVVRGDWNDRHCALRLNSQLTYEPMTPKALDTNSYQLPITSNGDVSARHCRYNPSLNDFIEPLAPEPLHPKMKLGYICEHDLERVLWVILQGKSEQKTWKSCLDKQSVSESENSASVSSDGDDMWERFNESGQLLFRRHQEHLIPCKENTHNKT